MILENQISQTSLLLCHHLARKVFHGSLWLTRSSHKVTGVHLFLFLFLSPCLPLSSSGHPSRSSSVPIYSKKSSKAIPTALVHLTFPCEHLCLSVCCVFPHCFLYLPTAPTGNFLRATPRTVAFRWLVGIPHSTWHSVIYAFIYLLSMNYVSGIVLSAGNRAGNKPENIPG